MAQTRRTLRPQVPFSGKPNFEVGALTGWSCRLTVSSIADGLRPIRRIQAMTFSKPLLGVPLAAFVFCAVLGPSTGPLLADGMTVPHSFQSGGVSTLEVGAVSARPGSNPDRILSSQANNKFSNNQIFRRGQVVVQVCKPSGAACSLPGECCSNSCVPPGFGGEPTCR